jgi:hypothetical protein
MTIITSKNLGIDESKLEYKDFVHVYTNAQGDECIDHYDYDGFIKHFSPETIQLVEQTNASGKHWIGIGGHYSDLGYFEIQWD